MPKTQELTETSKETYRNLMEKAARDIESLISELESETTNNFVERPPQDILFDIVPLLKKLKDAKKEAELSIRLYSKKKKS